MATDPNDKSQPEMEKWDADSKSVPLKNDGTYRDKFDWSKATRWPTALFMLLAAHALLSQPPFSNSELTPWILWLYGTAFFSLVVLIVYNASRKVSLIFHRLAFILFHWLAFIFSFLLLASTGIYYAAGTFQLNNPWNEDFWVTLSYFCYLGVLTIGHITEFVRRKDTVSIGLQMLDGIGSLLLLIPFALYIVILIQNGLPYRAGALAILFTIFVLSFPIPCILGLITNFTSRFGYIRHAVVIGYAIVFPLIGYAVMMYRYSGKFSEYFNIVYAWLFLVVAIAWSGGWLMRARVYERLRYDIRVTSEAEEDGWDDEPKHE